MSTIDQSVPRVAVITLFPEMFCALKDYGVSGRALHRGLIDLECFNPRNYALDRHQTVDDRPYGGGPGMVMRVEPLEAALNAALTWLGDEQKAHVIYMSPQGRRLDTSGVRDISAHRHLVLVCGRYEGVDERFLRRYVDAECSVGDYVLSGGEFPAMILLDAMIRRLPGALGDDDSAVEDSFEQGLLDCPHYTRPEKVAGLSVPDVLLSGDHAKIRRWRLKQSLGRTDSRRPDLLRDLELSTEQQRLLAEYKSEERVESER